MIKARITLKSDIRKFNNQRGDGQLFKIDLVDKTGGEVSATFFGKAVDNFYEMLQPQSVYYFSRGSVKAANKRFDKGEYVITFDENTSIQAAEEDREIPGVSYKFVPLADVMQLDNNTNIDVKAVIFEARDTHTIMLRRNNEERVKRELVLWDDSGADGSSFLELTIWGQSANDNFQAGTVIFAKDMRVSEWNGAKSLNGSSSYELNPDSPDAFALQRAFEEKKPTNNMASSRGSNMASGARETIEGIREADLNLGPPLVPGVPLDPTGPKSIHRHLTLATLTCIPADRPPFYAACPTQVEKPQTGREKPGDSQTRTCNKKVMQNGNIWQCPNGHQCERPMYRYLANRVQVVDHTGSMEVSFFDEAGRQIFGCDADEIAALWEDPTREAELTQRLSQLTWKRYLLRMSSKKETWQDEVRVRLNAEEGAVPNFAKEGRRMLSEVRAAMQAAS
jgi:replication factor A1